MSNANAPVALTRLVRSTAAVSLASAILVATAFGGCSSSSPATTVCTAGAQVSCSCPGGSKGVQVCASDGSALGVCECGGGLDASIDAKKKTDGGKPAHDAATDGAKGSKDAPTTDHAVDGAKHDGGGGDAGACDPVAQTGCASGQKCAWIRDEVSPSFVGHLGCVVDGTATLNGDCSYGPSGATTGYDDCAKGLACHADPTEAAAGTCFTICDTAASSAPGVCPANYFCNLYSDFFDAGAATDGGAASTLGLCASTCDPLTQTLASDGAPACGGGTSGGDATLGCYGIPSPTTEPTTFECAPDPDPTNKSDAPLTGGFFINGCAPGYVPALTQAWNNSTPICVALCDPGNTSEAAPANAAGLVGSGHTCPDAGAGGTHECRFWWWFEGATTPLSTFSNALGLCFDYAQYKYDSNGDGTVDATDDDTPSCATLSSSGHTFSGTVTDTQMWGCESVATRPIP